MSRYSFQNTSTCALPLGIGTTHGTMALYCLLIAVCVARSPPSKKRSFARAFCGEQTSWVTLDAPVDSCQRSPTPGGTRDEMIGTAKSSAGSGTTLPDQM